jgi:Matrixin
MSGEPAPRAARRPPRLRLALGVGASSAAGALVGVLLVLRALPASSSVDTLALAPEHPVISAPDLPVVTEGPPPTSSTTVAVTAAPVTTPAAPLTTSPPPARPAPAAPPTQARTASAAAAPVAGEYAFEQRNPDGSPARWDPCTPIHYVVNLAAAPPGAGADVAGAIARLAAATGLTFVADGPSTEIPAKARPTEEPALYGHRWAPLLIAWTHPGATDFITTEDALGEGGATWVARVGGPEVYVTGEVAIDAGTTRGLPDGFGPGTTIGLLLLHELGHAVGLAHVNDPDEVMYPTLKPRPVAAYGPGDLAGLVALGRGAGCDPSAPPA